MIVLVLLALIDLSAIADSLSLDSKFEWKGENRTKIQKMIDEYGIRNPKYSSKEKPVAVFDWDNTVIKNDVGDATFFWALSHDLIKNPKDWKQTSPYLTEEAEVALKKECNEVQNGILQTSKQDKCADLILGIYVDGNVKSFTSGSISNQNLVPAWKKGAASDTLEPAYAWAVNLFAGHSLTDVKEFSSQAIQWNLSNPIGSKQLIGTMNVASSIRVYGQMKDLIGVLKANGFDVWIVSASAQPIVEVAAREVGIESSHVIGIRSTVDKLGKLESGFESCGPYRNGNQNLITYRQGKRCWINKIIFSEKDPQKMMDVPSLTTFAAGDSDTDVFFVKDANVMKLVIDRQKPELMCNALKNSVGQWLINPMFIDPKAPKTGDYDCSVYGFK